MSKTNTGEVICLHIGQAGVQMGAACWELIAAEHGVAADGTLPEDMEVDYSMNTFFNETPSGQFVPRSILIDTEPTCVDEIRVGHYSKLFHPDLLLNGMEDAASNYARGRNQRGQLMSIFSENLRMVTESCDRVQGFMIFDSFGGGTGSGFGANLIELLMFEFHRLPRINVGIFPSPKQSPVIVSPYNSILFMRDLIEASDISFIMDNSALFKICKTQLRYPSATYHCLNRISAQIVSLLTSSLRYNSLLNSNLDELRTNLVPYPKFKFPIMSYSPLISPLCTKHHTYTTQDLSESVFKPANQLMECDLNDGFYMANSLIYRGDFGVGDINRSVARLKTQNHWVGWCPTGFKIGVCPTKPLFLDSAAMAPSEKALLMLCNNTAIAGPINRLRRKFTHMFKKKAFVHWFVGEGLEESEFTESFDCITELETDFLAVEKEEAPKREIKSLHYVPSRAKISGTESDEHNEADTPIPKPITIPQANAEATEETLDQPGEGTGLASGNSDEDGDKEKADDLAGTEGNATRRLSEEDDMSPVNVSNKNAAGDRAFMDDMMMMKTANGKKNFATLKTKILRFMKQKMHPTL